MSALELAPTLEDRPDARAMANGLQGIGDDAVVPMHDGLGPRALHEGADATRELLRSPVAQGRPRSFELATCAEAGGASRPVLAGLESAR